MQRIAALFSFYRGLSGIDPAAALSLALGSLKGTALAPNRSCHNS